MVTPELVRSIQSEELEVLTKELDAAGMGDGRAKEAAELFDAVALDQEFVEFLTWPAYEKLD